MNSARDTISEYIIKNPGTTTTKIREAHPQWHKSTIMNALNELFTANQVTRSQLTPYEYHPKTTTEVPMGKRNIKGSSTTGVTRNALNARETFILGDYVVQHYTASQLPNAEFAAKFNADPEVRKLFRFDVNAGHIRTVIEARDIPSNHGPAKSSSNTGLTARVEALERQYTLLHELILELVDHVSDIEVKRDKA